MTRDPRRSPRPLVGWLAAVAVSLAAPAFAAETAELAAARAAYQQASRASGESSAAAIEAETVLSGLLIRAGAMSEAVPHMVHVRDHHVSNGGADSKEALLMSTALVVGYLETGAHVRAETLARDTLERAARTRGADDLITLRARQGLAAALVALGRHVEAYPQAQAAYSGLSVMYGWRSIPARRAGEVLLTTIISLQYEAEAQALLRRLATPPPEASAPAEVTRSAAYRVALLVREQHFEEAITLGEPLAQRLSAEPHREDQIRLFDVTLMLGVAHGAVRARDSGLEYIQRAYDGYVRLLGPDHPTTLTVADTLGYTQSQAERPEFRAAGRKLMAETLERRRRLQGEHASDVIEGEVLLALVTREDPGASEDERSRLLTRADSRVWAVPLMAQSRSAYMVDLMVGAQAMRTGDSAMAYQRFSRAAGWLRARSADRRVTASGLDSLRLFSRFRDTFIGQVRAGWQLAHEP